MKNHTLHPILVLGLLFILAACRTEKAPLPELTYTGEQPRVQNPLSPEDSQKHIQLPQGFTAELFASEPNIINPIAMAWDERGRLWVVQSQDYPHELENDVGGDRITICEDTDGDGKADKFTDFATAQSLTTGIVIVKGGILVAQAPDIAFLADTNGDDQMDERTVLFSGFGIWDTHAGPANLKYGLDNAIWGSVGYSGFEYQFGAETVSFTRGVYRFGRDGSWFEPVGQFNNNTWGLGFNQNFEIFGSTANNNHCCFVGIPLRHYDYLEKLPSWALNADFIQGHYDISPVDTIPLQQVDVRGGYTAAAGANFYTAENYPAPYRNQMYVNAPTGHLVHLARIIKDGSGYKEEDGGNIFASTDAWTAPVYTETGPDGNLWVADWYNPVIQHNPDKRGMPNQIWNDDKGPGNAHLNELRDKKHGRIYVIKHKSGRRSAIQSLTAKDENGLLTGLKSENMFWRTTAQRLIVENQLEQLIPELIRLAGTKGKGAVHALWTLDGLGALDSSNAENTALLTKALSSNTPALQRAGLALLPKTDQGSTALLQSDLLNSNNLNIRLAALLRATELPETEALYQAIADMGNDPVNKQDKWLSAALKIYFREQNYETVEPEEVVLLQPSAEEQKSQWRFSTENPGETWMQTDFDDSNWSESTGAFGNTDFKPYISTEWDTDDIWLRKRFSLKETLSEPVLKVIHDDDYEVYVNGQLLIKENGYTTKYKYIRLDTTAARIFKKGENSIAVHCHNGAGRQYIDVGIGRVGSFKVDKSFALNTVPQKMAYDKTVLHAMAGQNIEIVLNNTDEMQHNLVLIEKGSLEAFGKIVDAFLLKPEAADMEYVPKSRYVLSATSMLNPGESGTIRLKLPDKPGDYPFVCTFPGHWQMMQGILKVAPKGSYIAEDAAALKIAVMGGGGSHEFEKYFGIADGKVLHQNGANTVQYTESSLALNQQLELADILVISNNKAFESSTKEAIFSRVNAGMPMLIYHPSTWYNWKDWPEYNQELVGGGSRSHEKLQEFEVKVLKPSHPIMKGVPTKFRITDELYRWEKDPEGTTVEVLAIGRGLESGEEFPVVWVVKHPKSMIVCNTLGHDGDAHGLPAYQTILNNSLNFVKKRYVKDKVSKPQRNKS